MVKINKKRLFPIFSLATLLIGATILTLPWVVAQAGFVLGLFFVVFNGYVSAYTGVLVMKNSHGYFSFAKRCKEVLGIWSMIVAHIGSIAVLFVALIAFHIFLAQNGSDIVIFLIDLAHGTKPGWWNASVCGAFFAVILFCLVLIPNPTLLIKLSSFAFVFVISVAVIIIYTGFTPPGGINISEMKYVNSHFALSIGVLSVSYFVHNVMNVVFYDESEKAKPGLTSKSPTARYFIDIMAAFTLDVIAYALIGAIGYVGYYRYTNPKTQEIEDIPDNYLMIFSSGDYCALVGRILLCVKITICFPVVFRALRSNLLIAIFPWKWLDRGKGSEYYRLKHETRNPRKPSLQSQEITTSSGIGDNSDGGFGNSSANASAEEAKEVVLYRHTDADAGAEYGGAGVYSTYNGNDYADSESESDGQPNSSKQSTVLLNTKKLQHMDAGLSEEGEGEGERKEQQPLLKGDGESELKKQTREPAFLFFVHILPSSILCLFVTTAFAVWYQNVGQILSFGGSFCGLLYVYLLPCVLEMRLLYVEYKSCRSSSIPGSSMYVSSAPSPSVSTLRLVCSFVAHTLLILYGVAALVLQFVPT